MLRVPRPKVAALLTSAAEPEAIERICVKLRVVSGTEVMVLASTTVPLEAAVPPVRHWQGTGSEDSPRSSVASNVATSEMSTGSASMRDVLKPCEAN